MIGTSNTVRFWSASAIVVCGGVASALASGPSFTIIPPAADEMTSAVLSVSGNGRYATGASNVPGAGTRFWTWTPEGGRVNLPTTPGWIGETIRGVSNDGTTAGEVQTGPSPTPMSATRRPLGGPTVALGPLTSGGTTYRYLNAHAISDDGTTVVGDAQSTGGYQAWVSRNGSAPSGLGWLPGTPSDYSIAQAVNADGSVIVGTSTTDGAAMEYREGSMRRLADPSTDVLQSNAYAVTSGGEYILGTASRGDLARMSVVIWGPDRVPLDLGRPVLNGFRIGGIADGGMLAAISVGTPGLETGDAFVWSAASGYQRLFDYAASFGVIAPSDLMGNDVRAMSRDGSTFVGYGRTGAGVLVGWVLAVPNVGGLSMLGLACLLSVRRRRRT